MKLPKKLIATVGVCAALVLAGCSNNAIDDPTSADNEAAQSGDDSLVDQTGGECDAILSGEEAPEPGSEEADEAASMAALESVNLRDIDGAPVLTYDAPLPITTEVVHVADEGDGEALSVGQLVTFNYMVCDIVTGEKMFSTWGKDGAENNPIDVAISEQNFGPILTQALEGVKVGSRLLWGQAGLSADMSYTGAAQNGYIYVMSLESAQTIPDSIEGEMITPDDASLPLITIEDGVPAVSVPDTFVDPTELVVVPLIEGTGPVVESGQTVAVKYTGWLTDGTQFDSSWDRSAPDNVFMFGLGSGQVIPGWEQAVADQKVGSRLLVVVPADLGYGENEAGEIPANSTLIFAIDILAAY